MNATELSLVGLKRTGSYKNIFERGTVYIQSSPIVARRRVDQNTVSLRMTTPSMGGEIGKTFHPKLVILSFY